MVLLDLLTIAGLPTAVGASEAVHQQQLLDEEAEAPERQEPFYVDVFCDAQSRKKDEVHGTIIVLKDGKVRYKHPASFATILTGVYSCDCGPKTPKLASQMLNPTAARHHTLSRASSTRFLTRTSTYHTALCPRLQFLDS